MSDFKSILKASLKASFDDGRHDGRMEALRVMVAVMERSTSMEAKTALLDACEHVSRLKDRDCNESI